MLFYFEREVTLPSKATETVNIVVGSKDSNGDNVYTCEQLAKDAFVLDLFNTEASLKVAVFPGKEFLYVTLSEIFDSNNCLNVTTILDFIQKQIEKTNSSTIPQVVAQKLIAILVSQTKIDEELATCVIYNCLDFIIKERESKIEGPLNIGPVNFDKRFLLNTQDFVNRINNELVWPYTLISTAENVTKLQKTCEDELFIELPSRNALLNEELSYSDLLPKPSELCDPYNPYNIEDITRYKEDPRFPESMYPFVEGKAKNNNSAIYDNEQKYYTSLMEWVQFNMKSNAYGDIDTSPSNPNIDKMSQTYLEELAKLLYAKHWYHNLNIPIFSALDDDELSEFYDNDSTADNVTSDYKFRATPEEKAAAAAGTRDFVLKASTRVNAFEVLISFLREASLIVGYKAYLEAIIQLARWGERKPTSLVIEGYSLIFTLGDNKVKPYIGNISEYKLKTVDGCEVVGTAAMYDTVALKCKDFMNKCNYPYNEIIAPVGLTCEKTLEKEEASGKIRTLHSSITYSIIDIVNSYVNGDGKIKVAGIKYNDSAFTAEGIVLDKRNTYFSLSDSIKEEDNLETPFKSSQEFEDLVMELDVNSTKIFNHFDILNTCARQEDLEYFAEVNKFSSAEDLNRKAQTHEIRSKLSAFKFAYGVKLLPIYARVSLLLNEISEDREVTFSDVLNVYKEVLSKYDLNIFSEEEASDIADSKQSDTVQAMNVFGNSSSTDSVDSNPKIVTSQASEATNNAISENVSSGTTLNMAKEKTDADNSSVERFTYLRKPASDAEVSRVIDKAGNTVGFVSIEGKQIIRNGEVKRTKVLTLHDEKYVDNVTAAMLPEVSVRTLVPRFMMNIYSYEIDNTDYIVLYFDNVQTMKYYVRLISQIVKEDDL